MKHSFTRNFGISSDTSIKCDGTFKNIRQILLENEINYTDIEETDLEQKVTLIKPLHLNLSHTDIIVNELYYSGYIKYKSVVFDNGIQDKLSINQPVLITYPDYNKFCSINHVRYDDELLIFKDNKLSTTKLLSSTTVGLEPTWSPFCYNNKNYITESGLILN